MTFLYFAYGSNLKLSEMQRTCPSAQRKFKALLNGHRLVFPRESTGRQCGVASVESFEGCKVWGGVYAIPEAERAGLERREGYRPDRAVIENAYLPKDVTVFEDGDSAKPHHLLTFIANAQGNPPLPSDDYKSLIVSGAIEWNLAPDYLSQLQEIKTLNK